MKHNGLAQHEIVTMLLRMRDNLSDGYQKLNEASEFIKRAGEYSTTLMDILASCDECGEKPAWNIVASGAKWCDTCLSNCVD